MKLIDISKTNQLGYDIKMWQKKKAWITLEILHS